MGRGKHFNHKIKGHDHEKPKHGHNMPSKLTEDVEFSIEPVAKNGQRPVEIKRDTNQY